MKITEHIVESKTLMAIFRPWYVFQEWVSLFKRKKCAICKNFTPFLATSGFCSKSTGCLCRDMRDMFDTCDCGKFKAKKPWDRW